ncbi:MAG: hypothetical protein M3167_09270 [Acidobacteriota bacterium]|nr:hypothetical protein [Acidobacteriota bacterium]
MRASTDLAAAVARVRGPLLLAGIAGIAGCAVGAFTAPVQFFRSYLFACVFWSGLALGSLAVLMLRYVTGGAWGVPIRRPLESATRTLPLVALFFVPLLFGLKDLYAWARPDEVARDPLLRHKAAYLNVPFFVGRGVVYVGAWLLLAFFLNRWSEEQDRSPSPALTRRLQLLSSGGLVVYGLTITFWSIDWLMSLEPRWYSTMYGVLLMAGQALSALAFVIALTILLSRFEPLASILSPEHLHDLGKLLLAFVMFWAYVSFSQYLIIWAGNLPEEIPWYLRRLQGGWGWFGIALIVLHFALPFLLLLSADANRNPRLLSTVAVLVVVMRVVDLFWLVRPVFSPGRIQIHWLDLAAFVGLGGIWLSVQLWQLLERPLLPRNDPEFAEALEHAAH